MAICAVRGGCPSDYVGVSVAILSVILLLVKAGVPYLIHKIPRPKGSDFWLVAMQVIASFNLLLSIVMALGFLRFRRKYWWSSCYIWAVWVEGPLGFGLLLSCRIGQAFQLYNLFVKHTPWKRVIEAGAERRLPPIRSFIFLSLVLFPWIVGSAILQITQPLNHRCHMKTYWIIPVISVHALYIAALVGFTGAIQHIEFRFHELKDLWRGILVSACCIGVWVVAYTLNEIYEDNALVQIISRSVLLIMTSFLLLAFFSMSISQPLASLLSSMKNDQQDYTMMGRALGIPDSGLLVQQESTLSINPNEPLDKLLADRRFRQSFVEFADSCLAGESVHFYEELLQFDKIPVDDHVRRIYMARHIIDTYITPGATMEVNISHRCRQEILSTPDLAHPDLFKNALVELIQLMKMNLANDYWSSTFFMKLKEEDTVKTADYELEQSSWKLSSVHCADDPFHQEISPCKLSSSSHELSCSDHPSS